MLLRHVFVNELLRLSNPTRRLLTFFSSVLLISAGDVDISRVFTQKFDIRSHLIQLSPPERFGLFRESDRIFVRTTNGSKVHVFTLRGDTVYEGRPGKLPALPVNHYFVETDGDRTQFAVLPDNYHGATFLGAEADSGTDIQLSQKMEQIQPAWVRAEAGRWEVVEARRGERNWVAMDRMMDANAGRKIIAYAGDKLPVWVNSTNLLASYTQFVRDLTHRYRNQLTAIEVWNEPWYNKFPNTTNLDTFVAFYLQLMAQARRAVKAVNPSIQVIGPAFSGIVKDEPLAMTNSLDLFDGWSWHDYERGLYAPDQDYGAPGWSPALETDHLIPYFGSFVTQKPLLVDELGLYGQSALGIANTTTNPTFRSNLDWYRGMCRAMKTCVMYRATGVEVLIPHVFALFGQVPRNPNLEVYGWDASTDYVIAPRGPHPKTSAFLMTCYWLNGAQLIGHRALGDFVFLYAWKSANGRSFVMAWCAEGHTAPLAMKFTDFFGRKMKTNILGEEPVMIHFEKQQDPEKVLDLVVAAMASKQPDADPISAGR
jgi:hypothetical protein